jgi:hypothetical protein
MTIRHRRWRLSLAAGVVFLGIGLAAFAGDADVDELLRFGTEMARDGHWREAKFRWEQALKQNAGDPRLLNNLAIAEEALGEPDRARELFAHAEAAAPRDGRIAANAKRSSLFWGRTSEGEGAGARASNALPEDLKKKGHDVVEVTVSLPVPPRLKLDGVKTILVASFLVNDSQLVDVNHELVRFLRGEFHKHTAFEIQDVNPPPAVPEQTLDEMAANAPFFRWLGHEHGSDVVVTGAMRYTKRDASGFEDVDIVSEATGQKVRQTQFVTREEFTFLLDVLYFRGADGSLLFRDRMRRQAVFHGSANDPISAFYELGNAIAGDVLAVVSSRTRSDARLLFKG